MTSTSYSRALLGIALTPVLVLAAAASAAAGTATATGTGNATATATGTAPATDAAPAAAATRAPGPWGTSVLHAPNPDPASSSGGLNALVSAGNGTLVSLTGDGLSRSTRIRPAGSTTWLAPKSWPDAGGYNTELVALGDGSVCLVWRAKRADDQNNYWLKVATLAPGATAFSEPEYVAAVPEKGYQHLAAAPDGRLVAVWSVSGVVKAAEKAARRPPGRLRPPSTSSRRPAAGTSSPWTWRSPATAPPCWCGSGRRARPSSPCRRPRARPGGPRSRTSRSRAWSTRCRRWSPIRRAASTCSTAASGPS